MTLRTAEAWPGTIPWRACLPYLVAAFIYLVILISGQSLLNDPDSYWHVAVGRWIVEHGALPVSDPFSFTFAGEHWIAKEWLSQLLFAGADALAGWPGMVILAAAAAALAFALLARWLERELSPMASLVLVAATFVLAAPHLTARPHVLAWPVIVLWVGGIVRAVDRRQAPSLWLPLAMVLWANLHGGFTLGILLAGVAGLDAILSAPRDERLRTAFVWFRFGILTLAAASITPYGPESMLVTGRVLGLGSALGVIGEWRPTDFSRLGTFEIILFLAIALALSRGFKLSPGRIIAILGILHLALAHERNSDLLGLIAPVFLAAPLARQFPALGRMAAEQLGLTGRTVAAAVLAALIPASWAIAFVADFRPADRITPTAAVAALRAATTAPVMNSYDFGGYLIANRIPTFIDGRTELYGGPFTIRYQNAVTLADLDDFVALLDKYRIGATLFWPGTPANAFLDRLPGWHRLYADDVAVVYVKDALP